MAVDKLPEFAKDGQKNTENLNQEEGFPVNLKPARQWFNYLFNKLSLTINQIIDEDYIRHNELVDNLVTDVSNKPLSAKQGKYLQDNKIDRSIKIPENADLNDYKKEGTYFVDYNLTAETIKNSPTNLAFTLQVDVTAGFIQRLTTYKEAGTLQYIRSQYVSGWTSWYKTYSELDPQPTVDAIDNLTSNDAKRPLSANQGRLLNINKFDKSGGNLSGEISINTGESSPIKTVVNKSNSITTNSPNNLAAIIHALSFGWYESEWQIGNVRSGSQETAGFGLTLGNSNLRFLVNANGTSNYGTFDSVGNITAPLVIGKLQGRVRTEISAFNSDNAFLDKYTSGDSSSFFFDNGGDNKYFTNFSVGVSANLQDGGYFLIGASPLDNKIKAMSGVKEASGGYRLQKNLTLLDSESNNNVKGDFVWDHHKLGGWARGLVFRAKADSSLYSGFGAYGNTDTVESVYFGLNGENLWGKGNGKGVWLDSNGAYTNCKWTFTDWVSGAFNGVFDGFVVAKDTRNITPAQIGGARMGYYFAEYTGIRYGTVTGSTWGDFLALNGYSDSSGGKVNGLFFDKVSHQIYHFQNNYGANNWGTPRQIAYTDNQTFIGSNKFNGDVQVTGSIYAQKFKGESDFGFLSTDETRAKRILTGGLLASDSFSDSSKIPNLGIFSKGHIYTASDVCSDTYRGYVAIAKFIGNLDGKLFNPRMINGVAFDASIDINIPPVSFYITAGADLNNYQSTGFFFQDSDAVAQQIANVPQANAFSLRVERSAGCSQWFTPYNGGGLTYYRHFYNGSWSNWVVLKANRITLSGAIIGSATFDESGNISIPTNLQTGIGINQYYQDVTASRISGVVYTNNTGNTIFAIITASGSNNTALTHQVSGVQFINTNESLSRTISYAIPDGASYMVTAATIYKWSELRR
ncbi:pyocin knob domain-containing protein [Acinetobacter sp. CE-15]|uniref:pyocin knob domain-containing protein n=1 Tax=Acinetobacter sp. CE-15 TaxID=3425693 RepID=UPI003DA64B31